MKTRSLRKRIGVPLLLVALSTVVAVGIAEVALRLIRPQVFPTIPAGLFTDDPAGFRELTPRFRGTISRAEFSAPVGISEFGVRGPGPRPRQPNTRRLLLMGDSQTFGFGVLDHETYAVRLQELLAAAYPESDIQVVNAGVPGYGTVDHILWLRKHGQEVDPDLVVVQFLSVNDFKINRGSAHVRALLDSGAAPAAGGALPKANQTTTLSGRIVGAIHSLKRKSHVMTLISESLSYAGMRLGLLGGVEAMWGEDFTASDSAQTRSLIALLAAEAKAMGIPVVFLYTTGKAQVIAGDGSPLRSAAVMASAASDAGVPWIDMTAELRKRPDRQRLYFVRDGHWTAAGHRAVAEVLVQRLPSLGLMPPRTAGGR
jgi:lysophospholipase L1-like esterase